jgi:primosomal protein N' (replication factor Y)
VEQYILKIALDAPLDILFDYRWEPTADEPNAPQIGQLAQVSFGKREAIGLIVAINAGVSAETRTLKPIIKVHSNLPPLDATWIALCQFAAEYYQRPLGEVALPALPKNLRTIKSVALERALKKMAASKEVCAALPNEVTELNSGQQKAVETITQLQGFAGILLYGVTGSGKTEVYLQAAANILANANKQTTTAQILILVPEINLTPQLESNIRNRFPTTEVATLHSGLSEGERLKSWLAAHTGRASIVLGTRLAILASMPNLKMIVIDEEHDPSYKQQEGLRYSARDLAVWRAHQLGIPVVLGSATPSLESWQHAESGRYKKVELRERAAKDAVLPQVKLIDMERDKPAEGITSTLVTALKKRLDRGEQSLLFLNRRGYAPVIACDACGWVSSCPRCTAFMVLHKHDQRLRCHHCSLEQRIPKSCPTCGNVDIQPLGRGTQRIEEFVQSVFPQARIMRIDADSTRRKGSAKAAFEAVHRGEVDILIGTQMVAKGHDFQNLTLVGALNPDTALFSQDYRASERLFSQLMQVAGRAGRAAQKSGGNASEVLIQTRYPQHPLYAALIAHDYERFAASLLQERKQAGLPPYMYQALLRAEAKELKTAIEFLEQAAHCVEHAGITMNDPIPMAMTRIANVERAQLLVESASRPALQAFLKEWVATLRKIKTRARWSLEVDPVDI